MEKAEKYKVGDKPIPFISQYLTNPVTRKMLNPTMGYGILESDLKDKLLELVSSGHFKLAKDNIYFNNDKIRLSTRDCTVFFIDATNKLQGQQLSWTMGMEIVVAVAVKLDQLNNFLTKK